jgi:IS5 family transposase
VDTTVVETNIHWPTDATLLWDTVRVLTRLIGRLRDLIAARHFSWCAADPPRKLRSRCEQS